jgi:hypothetical protein
LTPWKAKARVNKPTQKDRGEKEILQKCLTYQEPLQDQVVQNRLRGGLESPDPVIIDLLAVAFESGVALGATSVSTYAAMGPPSSMPLDPVIAIVFLVTAFGSGGGMAAFLESAYATLDPPPPYPPDSIIIVVFLATAFGSGGMR